MTLEPPVLHIQEKVLTLKMPAGQVVWVLSAS